jgi:hypothetical protein
MWMVCAPEMCMQGDNSSSPSSIVCQTYQTGERVSQGFNDMQPLEHTSLDGHDQEAGCSALHIIQPIT